PPPASDGPTPDEPPPQAPAPRPDTESALKLEAAATFKELARLGQFVFRFVAEVDARGEDASRLTSGNLLLAHPGGWLAPLDPETLDGSFFRGEMEVPGGAVTSIAGQEYSAATPATHALLSLWALDGHAQLVTPIVRLGHARPDPYTPPWPYGIGLVGPIEVVRFSDGASSLMLIGQHQALDGNMPTDVTTSVSLGSDRGASEPIAWNGLDARGDRTVLWPFVRRLAVDDQFTKGQLRISTTATLDGKPREFTGTWPVHRVEPETVRSPVLGTWQLSNGPGQTTLHDHYTNPQHRYAYDFVVLERGRTHSGDPHRNESYFAWSRSVRASADGVVVAFCDGERDNPGYRGAVTNCHTNHVVIRHASGLHTAYLHLRQRSITKGIKLDSPVTAGQVIGRVGNSGESSEPHLHFMAFRIDETGRWRSVPVTFSNAYHDAKANQPLEGVPLGGSILHLREAR
ncbi:MAG: M23 family metallopeptidase, partial [Planctomycetota bacterium]|nr:M23 family metallopeptidase [Planctomycetota bacterium]